MDVEPQLISDGRIKKELGQGWRYHVI